jgi:hypothetical protein
MSGQRWPDSFTTLVGLALTYLFLFGTTMYLDRRRPVRNFVYSLLFALVVYYVFTELLTVVLPAGPLGLGPV